MSNGIGWQKKHIWSLDKKLRDVFVHLYEWHQLLLNWVKNNSYDGL
ncbi:ClbS/DfsB family four-helix bundle protein [Porphyromonas circumdentaria]